ncbi:uncharacterized protein LOC108433882 [Pygocentrus nattereri]|uniref:uncharacterized protein LOC108433882 n=1 Tax=Pygocentrus nattereri TaxID=42514 RepID=UPI00081442F5|nr:uncharacterized protein LOC108433882 [Pygocentrus nattereri]
MNAAPDTDASSLFGGGGEAAEVEAAVRAAVISIMKVFVELSDRRARNYQLKLAEVERENLQLRLRLKAAERRRSASSGESYEISANLTFSPESSQSLSTGVDGEGEGGGEAGFSHSVSEQEASDCRLYKEEAAYEDTFWIKNEITDENPAVDFEYHVLAHVGRTVSGQPQQQTMSVERCGACNSFNHCVQEGDAALTSLERRRLNSSERVRQYRARIRADPEKYLILKEKERLRYLQRRKTIADLSEPMKKLKRKAWREAARRHRARKVAQATLAHAHVAVQNNV